MSLSLARSLITRKPLSQLYATLVNHRSGAKPVQFPGMQVDLSQDRVQQASTWPGVGQGSEVGPNLGLSLADSSIRPHSAKVGPEWANSGPPP